MAHEVFVRFEQAKALKKLGFDWECNHYYHIEDNGIITTAYDYANHNELSPKAISAPTLAQAQKWLREVKGIALNITAHDGGFYHWEVVYLPNAPEYNGIISPDPTKYDTYEQALSVGIDKTLELLKQDNNGK